MNFLDLYTVKTDYIDYLKNFQVGIWDNIEKGRLRPYVGVVVEIGRNKYYAPLSSPKPKHEKMSNRIDFVRLQHGKQLKAVLNLNNMIPVDDSLITRVIIKSVCDTFYKELLTLELIDIKRKSNIILKNANSIYSLTTSSEYREQPQNKKLVARCYDFLLLEEKLSEYINKKK